MRGVCCTKVPDAQTEVAGRKSELIKKIAFDRVFKRALISAVIKKTPREKILVPEEVVNGL